MEDIDLPGTMGFKRPEPTEPGESYGDPYWDDPTKSLLQKELTTGKVGRVAGAPSEGAGAGAGKDEYSPMFDDAMAVIKTYVQWSEIPDTIKMMAAFSPRFLEDPQVRKMIGANIPDQFKAAYEKASAQIDWILAQRSRKMPGIQYQSDIEQQQMNTADQFLREEGLR